MMVISPDELTQMLWSARVDQTRSFINAIRITADVRQADMPEAAEAFRAYADSLERMVDPALSKAGEQS